MGVIRHNAMIVTMASYFSIPEFDKVHNKAVELFKDLVTPIISSNHGELSFLVGPDGSKEQWPESNSYDQKRSELVKFIDRYIEKVENFNPIYYIDVSYGEALDGINVEIDKTNVMDLKEYKIDYKDQVNFNICSADYACNIINYDPHNCKSFISDIENGECKYLMEETIRYQDKLIKLCKFNESQE